VGLGLGGGVIVVGGVVAPPDGLGVAGWHALVSLIGLVPILALEALPDGATSLLLVAVWVLGGIVPPRTALSGFATTTWILTVSVFAIGAAVATSGLLYRLALGAVARAPGFRSQVATLGVAGLVIGAAVPNATGRMSLVASAITELAEALGYQPGSRAAAGLAMAALVGFGQMAAAFLTSSSTTLLAFALLPESSKASLNWAVWAVRAAPLHIFMLVGLLICVVWRYAPGSQATPEPTATLGLQRALLGRPSRHEIVAGLVTVGLLIGFATQPLHGVDPAWISVIAFVVMTDAGVLTVGELRIVNWNTVLLLASMAEVVSTSLVLRWQAAVPLIIIALAPVAGGAGIDPWVVAMVTLTASNTFFLPYQSTLYLALVTGTGSRLFSHAQARPVAIAFAVLTLIGLLASVPIWHVMGLL
jgi:di/tricarboxylate transporter